MTAVVLGISVYEQVDGKELSLDCMGLDWVPGVQGQAVT